MFSSLDNYTEFETTKSCFLDGRYIPLVLAEVTEFHKDSIHIFIDLDEDNLVLSSSISGELQPREGMNIIRIIITADGIPHSALVWIDTRSKTITFTDVRSSGDIPKRVSELDRIIDKLLKQFFSNYKYSRDIAYVDMVSIHCEKFGFCNAYVTKQVVDYVLDRPFDPSNIGKFVAAIESEYSHLLDPNTEPEVEYWGGLGLGLGLLGGVAIGSAIAAPRYQQPVYYAQPTYAYPVYGYPQGYY